MQQIVDPLIPTKYIKPSLQKLDLIEFKVGLTNFLLLKLNFFEPPKFCKTSNNLIVLAWYHFPLPFLSFLWIDGTLKHPKTNSTKHDLIQKHI